jgi:uncharacterized phiE125 gp8 family phage protein
MDSAVLTTAPTVEPITLVEAQSHLKVSGESDYLTSLIKTARVMIERYLNRSLILQTWTAYSHRWCDELCLPYPPLLSVTSVKYYDLNGTLQTLADTNYWLNNKTEPAKINYVYDFTPPELQYGRPNSIEVVFTAGYLASGTDAQKQAAVPDPIKHAMKVLLTDMYEHRGQYVIGHEANKIPSYIIDLIHTYKIY